MVAGDGRINFFNEVHQETFTRAQEVARHIELARRTKDRLQGVKTNPAEFHEKSAALQKERDEKQRRKEEDDRILAAYRRDAKAGGKGKAWEKGEGKDPMKGKYGKEKGWKGGFAGPPKGANW